MLFYVKLLRKIVRLTLSGWILFFQIALWSTLALLMIAFLDGCSMLKSSSSTGLYSLPYVIFTPNIRCRQRSTRKVPEANEMEQTFPYVNVNDVTDTAFIEPRNNHASEIVNKHSIKHQTLLRQPFKFTAVYRERPPSSGSLIDLNGAYELLNGDRRRFTIDELMRMYVNSVSESQHKSRFKNLEDFVEYIGK
jgi:hypothetical protein